MVRRDVETVRPRCQICRATVEMYVCERCTYVDVIADDGENSGASGMEVSAARQERIHVRVNWDHMHTMQAMHAPPIGDFGPEVRRRRRANKYNEALRPEVPRPAPPPEGVERIVWQDLNDVVHVAWGMGSACGVIRYNKRWDWDGRLLNAEVFELRKVTCEKCREYESYFS